MQLRHLWQALTGSAADLSQWPDQWIDQPIADFVVDSRLVKPGAVFVALPGEHTDGHLYLNDALAHGAVAMLAGPPALEQSLPAVFVNADGTVIRRPDGENQASPAPVIFVVPDPLVALQNTAAAWRAIMPVVVVAVTGSVGKTTTKEMVGSVLAMHFNTLRSQGNFNNEIGLPLMLLRLTPAHERAVLEMGMYDVGEIARLCEISRPQVGIVTNVGPSHLERLGSIERIAMAKGELVQALPAAADGGVAILNYDDARVLAMRDLTRARVFSYGLDPAADLWADEIVSEGLEGIGFQLHFGKQHWYVRLDVLGRHSVHTALRAAAAGFVEGMQWSEIIAGLRAERGNLRLMVVSGLREATIIDDTYNASPASVLAALHLLKDVANQDHRSIAVLGDMLELGVYEEEGHRVVGGRAAQIAKKLVTVGPRAHWIAEEALASGMQVADVYPVDDNEAAIAVLQGLIRTGDVVLIKGSHGQHMEDIVDVLSRMREP
ncbi:MAG TPA: UDP-N-acetylmuramoyl-tripeptide--D-alanyl-D-alanine ligase [Anaerolineae bacterium]